MNAADEPHPDVQAVLEQLENFDILPLRQYGADEARELFAGLREDVDGPAVGDVEDREIPGFNAQIDGQSGSENSADAAGSAVPVRIYRPDAEGPVPTVVFCHGGGFVIGSVDSHDVVCRHLTNAIEATVVSVDYRLAPEHPFPAAVEDAYAATAWAAANRDALDGDGSLVVAGDSAGGNLSAAVTLAARDFDDGPAIDYQVLVYPVVTGNRDWESTARFGEGYFLDSRDMDWFHHSYLPNPIHEANPYANPLEARDLSGLPPATVVTAGFDPLRDQGYAYAEALADAGVDVTYRNYDDMIHGFFSMQEGEVELDAAAEALAAVSDDVRTALASAE